MNHKSAQRHLADYIDGSLSRRRHDLVDDHLEHCVECETEVRELRFTISLLRELADPEPPENLAESVLTRIAAGDAEPNFAQRADRWLGAFWDRISAPQYALPAAAAVALLAVLGIGPGPGFHLPTSPGFSTQPSSDIVARATPQPEVATRAPGIAGVPDGRFASLPPLRRTTSYRPAYRGRLTLASTAGGTAPVARGVTPTAYARPAHESRAFPSADEWIEILIDRPSAFAAEHRRLSDLELEVWVDYVARRAVETDRFDPLLRALKTSPEPVAMVLAEDFALLGGRR